jgi:Arc/MetJ family transcription regulator
VSHLVRYDKRTGEIKNWPVAEISLIDTGGKRQPANAYAVALPVIKSMYKHAGISLPDLASEPEAEEETPTGVNSAAQTQEGLKSSKSKKEIDMTEEEMLALLDKRDAALAAKAAKDAETARVAALEEENKALKADAAKSRRLPMGDGAPYQAKYAETWKYDNLDAASLALVIDMMRANPRPDGERPGSAMIKALALKCATGIKNDEDRVYVQSAMKAAGLSTDKETVEAAIKAATDPMYSTLSTGGSDWVGTAYSNEIWRIIREQRKIVAKIPSVVIPDGFSSEYFPVESTDPTWYKVAEATASDATLLVPAATITASQAVTARKQMTVAKMGARVLYTGELVEDSLIPFADQLKLQLQISGGEMLEHVVIDGDTATGATTNINCIGGTPVATDLYLLLDGLRKFGLVTNTGNSRSASGGLAINDFIETLWLMGPAGLAAADPSNCAFIVDPNVLKAASLLPEVLTKDVSTAATLENGWLTGIWGIPVFPSWFMHYRSTTNPRKANTSGKVDTTTQANNTTGAIVGVRFDQWKLGYKRKMTVEVNRIANADSYEVVALMRWGLLSRDTKYPAAITYNVGV